VSVDKVWLIVISTTTRRDHPAREVLLAVALRHHIAEFRSNERFEPGGRGCIEPRIVAMLAT
jgi:hypothetical protein